ncbi:MAG: HAD-IA family hydrolase, partial [Marinomonas sp.]
DGQADVCDTMEEAFVAAGHAAPDRNETRRLVGLSLPVAIGQLAPDLAISAQTQLVENFKTLFRARRVAGTLDEPLYAGISELLIRLNDAGWLLAVATGKSDRGLHACLDVHGIKHLFVSLQTADGNPSKPHPAMLETAIAEAGVTADNAVMIGDTSFDMTMAANAGVRAIGVEWGYHTPDELRDAGAADVARDMAHLEALL